MPIQPSDILLKYSTTTSPGNSASGAESTSLGGFISITQVATGQNGIFDDITASQNTNGYTDYKCIFVHNNNGSITLQNASVWIAALTASEAVVQLGVDPTAASLIASNSQQAVTVANSTTAPVGVTFSPANSKITAIALGDIPAGECRAFWLQRTVNNAQPIAADSLTLEVDGETT